MSSGPDESRTADYLTAGHVDGAVLVSLHEDDPLPARLASSDIPSVLVGRSVWAEAATLAPDARDDFLMTTGRQRLGRLVDLVDAAGQPWHARPGRLADAPAPGDGWYRDY